MRNTPLSTLAKLIDRLSRWYYYWRFDLHLRYLSRRIDEKP
ncbi:MAG: hypothetical protein AB8H47_00390 [Bacteroidia bacterium]